MDHSQSNALGGSQAPSPYQQNWNGYMYPPYQQCPPTSTWYQHPGANGPQFYHVTEVTDEADDASKETDEPDLCEITAPPVPSPTPQGKRKKVGGRLKLGNFLPEEDVNLVKSWLEISTDAVTNTGQKKERLWERILQQYNMRRGSYDERSVRSLQSRWDTIKAEVGKFCAYYADTVRENASGTSDADKTTMAAADFATIQKHNFGFMHCWEIMKDEPKWQDPKTRAAARAAAGDGFGEDTHHGAANDDKTDQNCSPSAGKRPMGRDAAKAAKKTANSSAGSAASAEYAARQQELRQQRLNILQGDSDAKTDRFQQQTNYNMSLLAIEQEKMQLLCEKYEAEKLEKEKLEDERILAIDINTCLPSQRLYYQMAQEEILERQTARRRARQARPAEEDQ